VDSRVDRAVSHKVQRRFGIRSRRIAVKHPKDGEDNWPGNQADPARLEIESGG
jgi:hypothetical protein